MYNQEMVLAKKTHTIAKQFKIISLTVSELQNNSDAEILEKF